MGTDAQLRRYVPAFAAVLAFICAASLAAAFQTPAAANYAIVPRDILTITVLGENDLNRPYTVDADGMFTFPWVGRVQAAGLTVPQLEESLKKKLSPDWLVHPEITIAVQRYMMNKTIRITGEVKTQGEQALVGPTSVMDALGKAGGPLPTAVGDVLVVRAGGSGASSGDGPGGATLPQTIPIDLLRLQSGEPGVDIQLQDGDHIYVPAAGSVYVIGQVKSPGAYPVPKNTTLQQALALAGGVTPDGAEKRISIKRRINNKLVELKLGKDFTLTDVVKADDTIIVPERRF